MEQASDRLRRKLKVMVLYGGRSGEHEISLRSAASVVRHLDRTRFEVVPVAIDPQGKWHLQASQLADNPSQSLPVFPDAPLVILPPNPSQSGGAGGEGNNLMALPSQTGGIRNIPHVDVVFPVMHGPMCEDGTIQGLLELAEVPYVGSGVLGSAVGMDKDVSKRLARECGLPVTPFLTLRQHQWAQSKQEIESRVKKELSYPVFVKPSNMGSSVGVQKVKSAEELTPAIEQAFCYDTKVLIEKAVHAREIEFAVLESLRPSDPPMVSQPGEIIPQHDFYSYEAKYIDEQGASLVVPAQLSAEQLTEGKRIAADAFSLLECEGMARVDLFLDKNTGRFFFNELNTIPGFTSISMYPKLWEVSGIPYSQLLSHLIDLAMNRHQRKQKISRVYLGLNSQKN